MKSPFQIVRQLLLSSGLFFIPQAWALDLNQASADALQSIAGLGPKMAQRIVNERGRGPFESLEHLAERVSGVGIKRIESFKAAGLTIGPTVESTAGSVYQHPSNPVRINTLKAGALKSNSRSKNSVSASRSSNAQSAPITPEIWLIDYASSNP
jgi:competence protein ComEA